MNRSPPPIVPTLTEVIAPGDAAPATTPGVLHEPQEIMVQQILQRMQLSLDKRVKEAVGRVVLEQTQQLLPRLQQEVEEAVRNTVQAAFAQAAGKAGKTPHQEGE